MRGISSLKILLFGIFCLCLVNNTNAAVCKKGKCRPEKVSKAVLKEGCKAWRDFQCPAQMHCQIDKRYPRGGMCECYRYNSYSRIAPARDDNELTNTFERSDCQVYWPTNLFNVFLAVMNCWILGGLVIKIILTIYRVKKNGGYKLNSSCIALTTMPIQVVADFIGNLIPLISGMGWDPYWTLYDERKFAYILFYLGANIYKFEIMVAWLDLVQKTKTLSKRSSTSITVCRFFLRLVNILTALAGTMTFYGNKYDFYLWLNGSISPIIMITTALSGISIQRVLCKNMNDVTNPNWKAAAAIRRVYLCSVVGEYAIGQIRIYFIKTLFNPLTGSIAWYLGAYRDYCKAEMVRVWFNYLLYGNRRYLKDYDVNAVSAYFGFTTIGLNSTIGRSSSASRSNVGSSASTTSTVEAADDKKEGTMA